LDNNSDVVSVGCRILWMDPAGLPLKVFPSPLRPDDIEAQLLNGNGNAFFHPATMSRRTGLIAIAGYRELWPAEDLDLFLRLSEHGRLANLHDALYAYRQNPSSVCHTSREQQIAAANRAVADAKRRRSLDVTYQEVNPAAWVQDKASLYERWTVFAL